MVQWAGFLSLSSFTSQYRLRFCELSKTPHVCFQSLSSPPEKNISLSLICQITFLCLTVLYVSEAKPQHAPSWSTGLKKLKNKRLRLWETNQPFPNYMPLFRQMKSLINAAILEIQLLLHLFWLCLNMCYKKGRVDDIFMISSVCWKNPFLKTNLLSDQKFNVF